MYAAILAGGSGSRFWPLSRELYPKPLLKLFGNAPMIQQTVDRVYKVIEKKKTIVVCNSSLEQSLRQQLGCLGSKDQGNLKFLIEPERRNTAAAIGLAALHIQQSDPRAVMAVFPSDHLIEGEENFRTTIRDAEALAADGYLVALGVRPTRPEIGFGYIQVSNKHAGKSGKGFLIADYVEKPTRERAEVFLRSDKYYWNSGIFVWRVDTFLSELKMHLPQHYDTLTKIYALGGKTQKEEDGRAAYRALPAVSIDYGVMEKTRKGVVVPATFKWHDVGSWGALDDLFPRDEAGNIIFGNVVDLGSTGSLLYGSGRLLVTIGLKNFVVVDTDDATLVCPKDSAQDVGKAVERLRERNGEEHLVHRTIYRPWGFFTLLEKGTHFKIKKLNVNPGDRLSLQMHHHRSEHWVVIAGTARVTINDRVRLVHTNESIDIPIGVPHRLENPGKVPLQIIEVQNGEYLEEDDIIRIDDVYGRVPSEPSNANERVSRSKVGRTSSRERGQKGKSGNKKSKNSRR